LALLFRPFALRLCRVFIITSVILHRTGDIGEQNHFLTGWLRFLVTNWFGFRMGRGAGFFYPIHF
jgi:hypothetical protein